MRPAYIRKFFYSIWEYTISLFFGYFYITFTLHITGNLENSSCFSSYVTQNFYFRNILENFSTSAFFLPIHQDVIKIAQ